MAIDTKKVPVKKAKAKNMSDMEKCYCEIKPDQGGNCKDEDDD